MCRPGSFAENEPTYHALEAHVCSFCIEYHYQIQEEKLLDWQPLLNLRNLTQTILSALQVLILRMVLEY